MTHGHVECSPESTSSFTCRTVCDAGYNLNPNDTLSWITCSDGQWSQEIRDFDLLKCVSKCSLLTRESYQGSR